MKKIDGILYANKEEAYLQLSKHMDRINDDLNNKVKMKGGEMDKATKELLKLVIFIELSEFVMELFEEGDNQ